MSDLVELAERCEKATGPDRDLDKAIAVANGWCLHPTGRQRDDSAQSDTGYTCLDCGADSWGNTGPTGQKRSAPMPAYTASLDAAMTLVQEGAEWLRKSPEAMTVYFHPENDKVWATHHSASGAIPALALCAAALRARAAEPEGSHP